MHSKATRELKIGLWSKAAFETSKLASKYPKKIGFGMLPLIIELRALGFAATASYEGSLSRPPWLDIAHDEKLPKLLGDFYRDRIVPADQRLTLDRGMRGSVRLSAREALPQQKLSRIMKEARILRYRNELLDFANFLHGLYFRGRS
jgi:hypothetical protein